MDCGSPVVDCKSIITDAIYGRDDEGDFFLPDAEINDENEIGIRMKLLSVNDLGHDGILHLTVLVELSWTDDLLRWDEFR